MKVTYFALRTLKIGDEVRLPGDLVPEANGWAYLSGYIDQGKIAAVLVVTLPEDAQLMLMEWEADQAAASHPASGVLTDVPVQESKPKEKVSP